MVPYLSFVIHQHVMVEYVFAYVVADPIFFYSNLNSFHEWYAKKKNVSLKMVCFSFLDFF